MPIGRVVTLPHQADWTIGVCARCGLPVKFADAYADLRGEPFRDYYHGRCVPGKDGA